jgi:threonine dehydrogenase-like Zn-dependent dehydrogenase
VRAVRILSHGEPEALRIVDLPPPIPGPSEVLIDVHVVGVSYPDLLVVRGVYQILAPLPFSPGKEITGVVSAVGERVTEFSPGDRVLAYVENGGYVEQIAVPVVLCHRLPDQLGFLDAIGLGLGFQTAHFALFERGDFKAGETVLVTGATGGVGTATIQLAKACGGRVVAGCMNPTKAAFARDHGAFHVVLLDRPDLADALRAEVRAATGEQGADLVVEIIGGGGTIVATDPRNVPNLDHQTPQIEPWPPPRPTDQATYSIDRTKFKTVGEFADALMARLNRAGMRHLRFWGAPNGVAVVVPMEAIDEKARPVKTEANTGSTEQGGPLSAIIEGFLQLVSEPIRDSRIFLFVLTNDSKAKHQAVPMTTEIGRQWMQNDYMRPEVNRSVKLTDQHFVLAAVYEFRKENNEGDPGLLGEDHKRHSLKEHLAGSRLDIDGFFK